MVASTSYVSFTVLLKWKRFCIVVTSILLLIFLLAFVAFTILARSPVIHQTQPVYGNVIYSPLAINYFLYARVGATVYVGSKGDLNLYNLTICQTKCSLKTQTKYFNVSNGACSTNRPLSNCFAQLDDVMHEYHGTDAQFFSKYLLRNSKITFRIIESNLKSEHVQLCVTTDKEACFQASIGNSGLCHKTVTLSKANNYTQTFTAYDDSYYCAVWLLENTHQWINYSTNSSIQVFNMSDIYSPHQCESFQKLSYISFPLCGRPKWVWETVCIVMEENSNSRYFDTFTIVSTADKRLSNHISVSISVFSGFVLAVFSFAIILAFIIHRYVSRRVLSY